MSKDLNKKLLEAIKSDYVQGQCLILAEQERILEDIKAKMQPKYDNILNGVKLVLNKSGKRREDALYSEKGEMLEINWERLYLLEDSVFKQIMIEKNKIDRENGYDVELNYCPILIAKSNKNETVQKLVDYYSENISEDFSLVRNKIENYNAFEDMMLNIGKQLKELKK